MIVSNGSAPPRESNLPHQRDLDINFHTPAVTDDFDPDSSGKPVSAGNLWRILLQFLFVLFLYQFYAGISMQTIVAKI